MKVTPDPRACMALRYVVDPDSGCWIWRRLFFPDGYPRWGNRRAHRASYEIYSGAIPPGAVIRHSCDRPACVNPAHLLCGDDAANVADRVARGRSARGERHGRAKLTNRQVQAIQKSALPTKMLARRYGVTPKAIRYWRAAAAKAR